MLTAALFTLVSALSALAMPTAYPIYRRQMAASAPTDTQILQYALTLENLEKVFYAEALEKYKESDFEAAGYPSWVRGRFSQIAGHESEHVSLLSGALGNESVEACTYSFPYTDVKSFISLATLIENVGVSAYAGAAQYITNTDYLTVAAIILSTEARHQSWMSSSVSSMEPWSSAYDTPLGLNMVYTIASVFITSCPDSNAVLPVKAYPTLTVTNPSAGGQATLSWENDTDSAVKYAIFYSGVGSQVVQINSDNTVYIPEKLQGISYVLVSTVSDASKLTPDTLVAGPAILDFTFDAWTPNPAFTGQ